LIKQDHQAISFGINSAWLSFGSVAETLDQVTPYENVLSSYADVLSDSTLPLLHDVGYHLTSGDKWVGLKNPAVDKWEASLEASGEKFSVINILPHKQCTAKLFSKDFVIWLETI